MNGNIITYLGGKSIYPVFPYVDDIKWSWKDDYLTDFH